MQQSAQYAIYRGTAPRKTKRTAAPSLKRHAASEYPESAAHHKCLFWLPHLRSPRGPTKQKDDFSFKKTNYFLTRPFFRSSKIGKLKKGAL